MRTHVKMSAVYGDTLSCCLGTKEKKVHRSNVFKCMKINTFEEYIFPE